MAGHESPRGETSMQGARTAFLAERRSRVKFVKNVAATYGATGEKADVGQALEALAVQVGRPKGARRVVEAIGLVGLYLFSFCAVLSISGAQVALVLMLVSFLAQARTVGRAARKEPLVWIAAAWALYMGLSATVGLDIFPATAEHQIEQARYWALLSLVVVAAWHFGGNIRRFTIAAALFALGAALRILIHVPWDNLGPFLTGQMWDLDTRGFGLNPISFSSYLAVILFWLAVFSPRLWGELSSRTACIAFLVVASLVGVLAVEGVIIGSSRGTWLATLVALVVLIIRWKPWTYLTPRMWWTVCLAAGLVLAVIVTTHGTNFLRRATVDQQVYVQIAEGHLEGAQKEYTSTGIRVQMWILGLEKWLERPLLGWGAGSERVLLEPLKPPVDWLRPNKTGRVPHSHNLLVELLMRFGMIGTLLFLALPCLIFARLRSLHRRGELARDVYSFFFALFVFVAVWSMFDIRIMRWDYRHFVLLFFGMAVSLAWTSLRTPHRDGRLAGCEVPLDSRKAAVHRFSVQEDRSGASTHSGSRA
jgi:O-antigen ligase